MSDGLPKLIRDKIPEVIRSSGRNLKGHVADSNEYSCRIVEKLREELDEFEENPSVEEAADIYEVYLAMLKNWNLELLDVKQFAHEKAMKRGKFDLGIVLDEIFDD